MPSNSDRQPISLVERRALPLRPEALTAAQRRAYRQLAIYGLGLDLPTLTASLRARRLQHMPELRRVPTGNRAA